MHVYLMFQNNGGHTFWNKMFETFSSVTDSCMTWRSMGLVFSPLNSCLIYQFGQQVYYIVSI